MSKQGISKTQYFIGTPTASEWSSVYFYSPQVPATFEQKGEIFAVISLSGPTTFDSVKAGDLLLDQLHEQYFESDEQRALLSLERAILAVKKRLLELLQNDSVSSAEGIDLSLLAMVVRDGVGYIVKMGESKLYGMRNGGIQEISSVLKDPDGRGEIKVGSLKIVESDRFLLTTPHGRVEISDDDLSSILEQFSLHRVEGMRMDNEALTSVLLFQPYAEEIDQGIHPNDEYYEEDVLSREGEYENSDNVLSKGIARSKQGIEDIASRIKSYDYKGNAKTFQVILYKTVGVAWENIKKYWQIFTRDILKVGDGSGLYLKGRGHVKTVNWRLIIFLMVVLSVGTYITVNSINENRRRAKEELEATQTIERLESEVATLGSNVATLVSSREKESEKESAISVLQNKKSSLSSLTIFPERISKLGTDIDNLIRKLEREIPVTSPTIVKDFGVIQGTQLSDISIGDGRIFVSDKGNGIIYSFDTNGGDMKKIAEGLSSPKAISYSELNQVVFVDEDESKVLGTINLENNQISRHAGISSGRLGNVSNIEAYKVSDNDFRVYGSRAETKEVIHLRKTGEGYALPELRLSGNGLNNLTDLDIDEGRVYVVSQGQGVRKFFGQDEIAMTHKGMINGDNWKNISAIHIDDRYMYAVDNSQNRILVFTKYRNDNAGIADYIASYDLSNFADSDNIIDLVSNRATGALYLLTRDKVVELKLSDLREFSY